MSSFIGLALKSCQSRLVRTLYWLPKCHLTPLQQHTDVCGPPLYVSLLKFIQSLAACHSFNEVDKQVSTSSCPPLCWLSVSVWIKFCSASSQRLLWISPVVFHISRICKMTYFFKTIEINWLPAIIKTSARVSPQVNHQSSSNNESYQERLARLEGDKESLVLQVSFTPPALIRHNSHNVNTMSRN